MKSFNTLQDALAYQLQGLMYGEIRIRKDFGKLSTIVSCDALAAEVVHYAESAANKMTKIERAFNYLLVEPEPRKNDMLNRLLDELHTIAGTTPSKYLKDTLVIGCLQTINAYKTAAYRNALLLAAELELDVVVDLLEEVVRWEVTAGRALAIVAVEAFNKVHKTLNNPLI